MRTDQYIGLTKSATEFIEQNEIAPQKPCSCCGRPFKIERKVCGTYEGMFEDEYYLSEYQLKDGNIAQEFLQASPWSSGPMFFIGLKTSDGKEFRWSVEEMSNFQ